MKKCHHCGHFETNEAQRCGACGSNISRVTKIEPVDDVRMICPKCRVLHARGETACSRCRAALVILPQGKPRETNELDWTYALSLFLPYVGILIGAFLAASDDESRSSVGRPLVFFSSILTAVYFCLFSLFVLLFRS